MNGKRATNDAATIGQGADRRQGAQRQLRFRRRRLAGERAIRPDFSFDPQQRTDTSPQLARDPPNALPGGKRCLGGNPATPGQAWR